MKRIIECLLEEGILEEDIHRILDLIEEEYEVVSEVSDRWKNNAWDTMYDKVVRARARRERAKSSCEKGYGSRYDVEVASNDLRDIEDRYRKLDDAIRKHTEFKKKGKIKPFEEQIIKSKEDKEEK